MVPMVTKLPGGGKVELIFHRIQVQNYLQWEIDLRNHFQDTKVNLYCDMPQQNQTFGGEFSKHCKCSKIEFNQSKLYNKLHLLFICAIAFGDLKGLKLAQPSAISASDDVVLFGTIVASSDKSGLQVRENLMLSTTSKTKW